MKSATLPQAAGHAAGAHLLPGRQGALAFRSGGAAPRPAQRGSRLRCQAEDDGLSDRLKAAEAEAQALRKQLEAARAAQAKDGAAPAPEQDAAPKQPRRGARIDGAGLTRESPFAMGPGQWISEETFAGVKGMKGPSEKGGETSTEDAAIVRRRLLLGSVASVAIVAASLVPTDLLRLSRPSKPLFFYLTPLVRVRALLRDMEQAALDGNQDEVEAGVRRIQGAPNFAEQNLRDAAAALPDVRSRERAGGVARDVIEFIDSIDYNKYYESMTSPGRRSGSANAMFLDFSLRSIRAAQAKLKEFLQLMPADQREAAEQQAAPAYK